MIKVEAPTLEGAYKEASKVLECSVSELQCEVVQYPSKGIFGFMKKGAIVMASCEDIQKKSFTKKDKKTPLPTVEQTVEQSLASEIIATVKDDASIETTSTESVEYSNEPTFEKDAVMDSFFEIENDDKNAKTSSDDSGRESKAGEENVAYDELALKIENELKELLSHACFEIDVVEVDVHDNTALIFIDGDDAALLIGKEGYRYNALSYMLFNWLYNKYELFVKLEIAEFLTKQQEMISSYIQPIIESVEKNGRGKTRFLDGILVQIALEELRERFPDKYVAIKTSKDGKKFVVINEFYNKSNG